MSHIVPIRETPGATMANAALGYKEVELGADPPDGWDWHHLAVAETPSGFVYKLIATHPERYPIWQGVQFTADQPMDEQLFHAIVWQLEHADFAEFAVRSPLRAQLSPLGPYPVA